MGRAKQCADRIRSDVPMVEILAGYGYRVRTDAGDRDQNFSCDLHGDGRDSRPSAIFYPKTNSAHCFACGRSRDAITWVREKEGLGFWAAVRSIEARFKLPPLPWSDGFDDTDAEQSVASDIESILGSSASDNYGVTRDRVRRYLTVLCVERAIDPAKGYALWEAYDKVQHLLDTGSVQERDATSLLHRILDKAKALPTESTGVSG